MTGVALVGVAYAEVNHGRWIARCPRPYCTNAMQVDRGQATFGCVALDGCGWIGELVWPADPDAIEALLAMRPVPGTRNWLPGETLAQLLAENVVHRCEPPEWQQLADAAGGSLALLDVVDEVAVGGLIHQQLEAAGLRRQIGA